MTPRMVRLRSAITCVMSDSETEATVLGKRERDERNVAPAPDASTYNDQSDEDIGPMPIPSDATGAVKKKRKGGHIMSTLALDTSLSLLSRESVLPHEKLYLEHLPNADQYYQSFMHREALNFCVMTKCVLGTRNSSSTLTLVTGLISSLPHPSTGT
jgi:peptidylprolyl isomerase domain and WD repeat-containing protein 1